MAKKKAAPVKKPMTKSEILNSLSESSELRKKNRRLVRQPLHTNCPKFEEGLAGCLYGPRIVENQSRT